MEKININGEIFKQTQYKTYYVSKDANVISVEFECDKIKKIVYMKHEVSARGYVRVPIRIQTGVEKKILLHRLVYDTWVGFKNKDNVIDHIDANPTNNSLNNLRECTQKENVSFCIDKNNFIGNTKFIILYDKQLNETRKFDSIKDMIQYYGFECKNGSISRMKSGSGLKIDLI